MGPTWATPTYTLNYAPYINKPTDIVLLNSIPRLNIPRVRKIMVKLQVIIMLASTSPLRGLALRGPSGGTCGGLNAAAGSVYSPLKPVSITFHVFELVDIAKLVML